MPCLGHTYTKKLCVVYLKFKLTWLSYILCSNSIHHFWFRDPPSTLCSSALFPRGNSWPAQAPEGLCHVSCPEMPGDLHPA